MCAGDASMGIIASTRHATKVGRECDSHVNNTQRFKSFQVIGDLNSFLKSENLKAFSIFVTKA